METIFSPHVFVTSFVNIINNFDVSRQLDEKLAYYAFSPAHGRGGSQDEVKLA